MQTVALIMFFITFKLILFFILKTAQCLGCARGPYMRMFINWLESTLFFFDFILLTIETYLEFTIDAYLAIN